MKIALFFTYNTSLKTWVENGMFDREVLLYQKLAEKKVDVTFITYGDATDYTYQSKIPNIKILPLYEHITAPTGRLQRFIHSFKLSSLLKDQWKQFDLMKTNQMYGAWIPAQARKINQTPFLVRSGYELYESSIQDKRSWVNQTATYFLSKLIYKSGHKVVVTSQDIANSVHKRFSIPKSKILIFPNYIDTELFKPTWAKKNNRLLCVGRLHKQKNLDLLIQAAKYNNVGLDIVGDGPLENELKKLSAAQQADVNFLGSYSNDQLPNIINQYLGFILCSNWEGCPKTLLEAMSCGAACIGTNVPGIKNLLVHNKSGLICEPEQESLNQCIKELISSEDLRKRLGKEARKYIEEHCSIDAILEKELALYKELSPHAQ